MTKILIIEDDNDIRANVVELLENEGFVPLEATTGEEGVQIALAERPQVVICDIMLPGMDGYAVLDTVRKDPGLYAVPFLFLTARAQKSEVRTGMNLGADDYLTKPYSRTELLGAIQIRLRRRDELARKANEAARDSGPPSERIPPRKVLHEPVVIAPAMRAVYEQARRLALSPLSVLIRGETGTGKDVLAEAIHHASPRADKPFVPLNCGALSETLVESELFGHEKGAFTGASPTGQKGHIESADGGTMFLDEIGDLPMALQVKLLRVLEDKKVMRVGGRDAKQVDVRFICATHKNLENDIAAGTFRRDLFFRINGASLDLPPLRARREEVAPLVSYFVERASRDLDRASAPTVAPQTLRLLEGYDWPGNVRELKQDMERAVALCSGDVLLPEHLPPDLTAGRASEPPQLDEGAAPQDPLPASTPYDELKAEARAREKERIMAALEECGGNATRAAEMLGISRRTLVSRQTEFGLQRPRKR